MPNTPTNTDEMRKAFEQQCKPFLIGSLPPVQLIFERNRHGDYYFSETRAAWKGWQSAIASNSSKDSEPPIWDNAAIELEIAEFSEAKAAGFECVGELWDAYSKLKEKVDGADVVAECYDDGSEEGGLRSHR
jgi:hypothetical protein